MALGVVTFAELWGKSCFIVLLVWARMLSMMPVEQTTDGLGGMPCSMESAFWAHRLEQNTAKSDRHTHMMHCAVFTTCSYNPPCLQQCSYYTKRSGSMSTPSVVQQ